MKKIIAILAATIAVDQLTKGWILSLIVRSWPLTGDAWALAPNPVHFAEITSWLNLRFTWNPGSAFSLLREVPSVFMIFLTGAIIGFLGYNLFARIKNGREKWAMALIVGGATGNLIDRVRFGAVIDFIDFHIGTWHWPAFNIADSAICMGVFLYILYFIKNK